MDLPKIIGIISLFLTLFSFVYTFIAANQSDEKRQRKHLLRGAILMSLFALIFGTALAIDCQSVSFGIGGAGSFLTIVLIILLVRHNIPKPIYS